MRKLTGFITERKFLIDKEALTAASKILYLINLIKNGSSYIEKYEKYSQVSKIMIPMEYSKRVKKIEKFNKEAYYYILKSFK